MPTTKIHYNGSKFAGEEPDTLDVLFERLKTEKLDPRLKPIADNLGNGIIRYSGNFETYSHAFSIETNDPDLIVKLNKAISDNETKY